MVQIKRQKLKFDTTEMISYFFKYIQLFKLICVWKAKVKQLHLGLHVRN